MKKLMKLVIIIALIVVGLSTLGGRKNTSKTENAILGVQSPSTAVENVASVTGVEVTEQLEPISNFSYDISGDAVVLRSYKGSNPTVEIQALYEIDGKMYRTDISDFQIGIGNSKAVTVVIGEGITEVQPAIFNSSNVQRVFFPKSMTNVYDYTLSYLHPKGKNAKISIYYAGTQDEWAEIFTRYVRKDVGDAELGEEMGAALADKLNEMMGGGYDSSLYNYYFSASPDNLR